MKGQFKISKNTSYKMINEKRTITQKILKFLPSYRMAPHESTNCPPADLICSLLLRTAVDIAELNLTSELEPQSR